MRSHNVRLAGLQRSLAAALPTAGVAAAAFALGEVLARGQSTLALWPLGAAMLGWFARGIGAADVRGASTGDEGRRAPVGSAPGAELAGALLAALLVGAASAALYGVGMAAAIVAAGIVLPLLGATLLARLDRLVPPRGVGSRELRLLAVALVGVPATAALRSDAMLALLPTSAAGEPFARLLFGDLLAATLVAPLMLAIGGALGGRHATGAAGPRPTRNPVRRMSLSAIASTPAVRIAAFAILGCTATVAVVAAYGPPGVARLIVVVHLLVGLWIARSVPGVAGAVLLGVNALVMARLHGGGIESAVAGGGADDLHEAAAQMLLAGVFALQFLLRALSEDARENARALIRQALRSDLSGLPNQRALGRIVQATLDRPDRTTFWMVGVVLPDIARWSDLTDSAAAAELERAVGGRLRATFEPMGGRVAHPSTGRFVITLGNRLDGIAIRQGLHRTLGGRSIDVSDQAIQLRYHAGMVEVPADAQVGVDAVLAALSMALQRAAGDPTGIHRVTVSAELLARYRTELQMVELVSRALNEGRVRLFAERMEPVRPEGSGGLHYEMLARVVDDGGALLEPRQFLPAIWHAGLSSKLDRLMFVRTIAYLAAHPALHQATRLCSINVAGPTLCDPEFPDFVQRSLSTHRVDPGRLMLEITESTAITDLELARAHVLRLSRMGLLIALDDFGTGLATFDYLKRLPADVLKIDGAFIRNLVSDGVDREIVLAIVRIARTTGALTVAEWIETAEQRAAAAELGVDLLQGRLISHPVPIERLRIPDDPAVAVADTVPAHYVHGAYAQRGPRRAGVRQAATAR
jgi:EAL domain-containing protein (putative c-di-GMP-specific phosphodiesterase class I)/GGDEF domain-containing protein